MSPAPARAREATLLLTPASAATSTSLARPPTTPAAARAAGPSPALPALPALVPLAAAALAISGEWYSISEPVSPAGKAARHPRALSGRRLGPASARAGARATRFALPRGRVYSAAKPVSGRGWRGAGTKEGDRLDATPPTPEPDGPLDGHADGAGRPHRLRAGGWRAGRAGRAAVEPGDPALPVGGHPHQRGLLRRRFRSTSRRRRTTRSASPPIRGSARGPSATRSGRPRPWPATPRT